MTVLTPASGKVLHYLPLYLVTVPLPLAPLVLSYLRSRSLLMTYKHVSLLQYLTPVSPCVLSPVVVSSVFPPISFFVLSLSVSRRRGLCPSVRCVQ